MTFSRVFAPILLAAALLGAWQALSLFSLPINHVLPSPAAICAAAVANASTLAAAAAQTSAIALSGLAAAAALGIALALVLHLCPLAAAAALPIFIALQNIPTVALAPIVLLLAGFGAASKLALIIVSAFYPVMLSLLGALATQDAARVLLLRSFGASRWQILRFYTLPHALSALFSGLLIAASYAFASAAAAELFGGLEGLGVLLLRAKKLYDYPLMFAAILLLAALSLAAVGSVKALQILVLRRKNAKI